MLEHVGKMPNFFILGAARTGTASLTHYLTHHNDIQFTTPRDPLFFYRDDLYHRGIDYYTHTFCQRETNTTWFGEASSAYFAAPEIVGPRLRAQYGDTPLKFIVILREPVSRAWSHYLACVHHGYEKRDFAAALAEEPFLAPDASPDGYLHVRYYADGRYTHLLNAWQAYYPLESFLFLLSEDLAANPLAQVRRVFMWLGVDTTMPVNVNARLNVARFARNPKMVEFLNHPPEWISHIGKQIWPESWQRRRIRHNLRERFQATYTALPPLDPVIAADLRQRYRGEILALSKLMGRYLSHWLTEEPTENITVAKKTQ